jgi:hypothetical protein
VAQRRPAGPITYTVNGQDYELNRPDENAEDFYITLDRFIKQSRHIPRGPSRRSRRNFRSLQAFVIALAFIALVGVIFVMMMRYMGNRTDDFLKVWAAVGPIVGVLTGLIPMYFFHNTMQDLMQDTATNGTER